MKTDARLPTAGDETAPLFFYMPNAKYGEFCQWYPSRFTVPKAQIAKLVAQDDDHTAVDKHEDADADTITFGCAEQFMMYCKAARFGDTRQQARIMATEDPKTQKRLGKEVNGFCDERWDPIKSAVVEAGNVAKFRDTKLRRRLLDTSNHLLVEAASKDRVWGIGFSERRAMEHRDQWGENRLGRALMNVRERYRREQQAEEEMRPWMKWEEEQNKKHKGGG